MEAVKQCFVGAKDAGFKVRVVEAGAWRGLRGQRGAGLCTAGCGV